MGGDRSVTASARTSYDAGWAEWRGLPDEKLINYLMKHKHGTPFEHNLFTFSVHAPIFVAREWMRHRIGSFNEKSGRYAELEDTFWTPVVWRTPDPNNKQGSIPRPVSLANSQWTWYNHDLLDKSYRQSYDTYQELIRQGVAREQARAVLPLGIYTDFVWSINARSLMHFLNLRRAENAQFEIREYTPELEELFRQEMPVTYEAWVKRSEEHTSEL